MAKELDEDGFQDAMDSGETWVIDFWAEWCGPCKKMKPIFEEVSEDVDSVNFGKVNLEDHQQLATQQGVRSIPAFLVFDDGEKVDMKMGAMQKDEFQDWVESHA